MTSHRTLKRQSSCLVSQQPPLEAKNFKISFDSAVLATLHKCDTWLHISYTVHVLWEFHGFKGSNCRPCATGMKLEQHWWKIHFPCFTTQTKLSPRCGLASVMQTLTKHSTTAEGERACLLISIICNDPASIIILTAVFSCECSASLGKR